jgi:hypothetical protein
MLFTFKSPSGADLLMFDKNAREILSLLGKNPDDSRGIILVEQLPAAIATLRTAIANNPSSGDRTDDDNAEPQIDLSQRVTPFVEMLERALQNDEAITWGV